jgi:large subunit ribosomal protein L13
MTKVTQSTKPLSAKTIQRNWHVIDIGGKVLGKVSHEISTLLQGKSKVNYAPYLDAGDYVVVINAKKVEVTGRKADQKTYTYYSGYPGGLRSLTFKELMEKKPEEVIRHAVTGMLPKNKLRDRRMARLFIFNDEKHPYENKLKTQHTKVKNELKNE